MTKNGCGGFVYRICAIYKVTDLCSVVIKSHIRQMGKRVKGKYSTKAYYLTTE